MKFDLNAVKDGVVNFFTTHFKKISADTLEWLSIIVIHCATIPTLLAMMTALSDKKIGRAHV